MVSIELSVVGSLLENRALLSTRGFARAQVSRVGLGPGRLSVGRPKASHLHGVASGKIRPVMARLPRLSVPGFVHHAIQRGHNRQPIFADAADYEAMLGMLAEGLRQHEVALHGYVLVPDHFHLLATPKSEGFPLLMQSLGRRYVRYFNDRHGRSGTLWDGRYRCTVIEPDRHLLDALAYLDLNPVRAALAATAADWRWSSHAHYVGAAADRLVTPPPQYWALGNTPFAREQAWDKRVAAGIEQKTQRALTDALLGGWALGDAGFVAELQEKTGRRVLKARAGRPRVDRSAAVKESIKTG